MNIGSFDRYDMLNNPNSDRPAFTIWFAGCSVGCKGCHNTQLMDKVNGREYTVSEILDSIPSDERDIILLGGEPLEQDLGEVSELCYMLRQRGHRIWLYTSKQIGEIPMPIINRCYFIKTGKYREDLQTGGFPASSNQKVFIRNENNILMEEI